MASLGNIKDVMFFNSGMCRYKSYGGKNDPEISRPLASIEVLCTEEGERRVYQVVPANHIVNGGDHSEERVVLHTKHLISAYQGHENLGAIASVWSKVDGLQGAFMVIGPISKLTFADENDIAVDLRGLSLPSYEN